MDCNHYKEKLSYHVNVSQVVDGKIQEVFSFNLGGHHDLAKLSQYAAQKDNLSEKHARQLAWPPPHAPRIKEIPRQPYVRQLPQPAQRLQARLERQRLRLRQIIPPRNAKP